MSNSIIKKTAAATLLAGAALGAFGATAGTAQAAPAAASQRYVEVCASSNYSIVFQFPQAPLGSATYKLSAGHCQGAVMNSNVTYVKVWGVNKSYYVGTGHLKNVSSQVVHATRDGSGNKVVQVSAGE